MKLVMHRRESYGRRGPFRVRETVKISVLL